MSLVGAISASVSAIFSLIALCMFFNPSAKIGFAVIISYLLLVLVIVGLTVTFIRWLQFLSNSGKLETTKCYNNNKRKFRIALIILGVICVILALFSTLGIFIFAQKLSGISTTIVDAMNKNETEPVAAEVDNTWYNETCTAEPDGDACQLCEPCADSGACDVCVGKQKACKACECDPNGEGFLCKWLKVPISAPKEPTNGTSNGTETEEKKQNPLDAFLGEPEPGSRCYNVSYGAKGIKRMFCQLYELTNSWHCKEEAEMKDKITCIAVTVGKGANKRFIIAALLLVSLVGHLVNLGVAIWCNGDQEAQYEQQSDDKGGENGEDGENVEMI